MSEPQMRTPATRTARRLFLITHPRSASNLLIRMLSLPSQPNLSASDYLFFPAFTALADELKLYARPLSAWNPTERQKINETYQACFDKLQAAARKADDEDKVLFIKEHACFMVEPVALSRHVFESNGDGDEDAWTMQTTGQTSPLLHSRLNVTVMPDGYLREWSPTFLIRHPALAFPSYRRATGAPMAKLATQMTLRWTRALYEWWYEQFRLVGKGETESVGERDGALDGEGPFVGSVRQPQCWPLVLDADDLMENPAVLAQWCSMVGLDYSKVSYSWAPVTSDQQASMPLVARVMTATLSQSAGIVSGKTAKGLDLENEVRKWKEEFGEEDGTLMGRLVKAAMEDYHWLRKRRLQA